MNEELKQEIADIIDRCKISCSVENFEDKSNYWYNIAHYYPLSENFIKKFRSKINIEQLLDNKEIPEMTKERIRDKTIFDPPEQINSRYDILDIR